MAALDPPRDVQLGIVSPLDPISLSDCTHDRTIESDPRHKIFLSHCGSQKGFVEKLCAKLDSEPRNPFKWFCEADGLTFDNFAKSEEFFSRYLWPGNFNGALAREPSSLVLPHLTATDHTTESAIRQLCEVMDDVNSSHDREESGTESVDDGSSGDSVATLESQADATAGNSDVRARPSRESCYETCSNCVGKKRSAATLDEDLISKIENMVLKKLVKDALEPLTSVLRGWKEDEVKHQEKLLAIEEQKLALKREEMQLLNRHVAFPVLCRNSAMVQIKRRMLPANSMGNAAQVGTQLSTADGVPFNVNDGIEKKGMVEKLIPARSSSGDGLLQPPKFSNPLTAYKISSNESGHLLEQPFQLATSRPPRSCMGIADSCAQVGNSKARAHNIDGKSQQRKSARSRNWTTDETNALLTSKLETTLSRRDVSERSSKVHWSEAVSKLLHSVHKVDRSAASCQQRWDTLFKGYRAIRGHEFKVSSGSSDRCISFWNMNVEQKSSKNLPRVFLRAWCELMERTFEVGRGQEKRQGEIHVSSNSCIEEQKLAL